MERAERRAYIAGRELLSMAGTVGDSITSHPKAQPSYLVQCPLWRRLSRSDLHSRQSHIAMLGIHL